VNFGSDGGRLQNAIVGGNDRSDNKTHQREVEISQKQKTTEEKYKFGRVMKALGQFPRVIDEGHKKGVVKEKDRMKITTPRGRKRRCRGMCVQTSREGAK